MKTSTNDRFQPSPSKRHEGRLQELRHERKTELQHLDGLKKALQSKLSSAAEDKRQIA
jgi:hypothetical protein